MTNPTPSLDTRNEAAERLREMFEGFIDPDEMHRDLDAALSEERRLTESKYEDVVTVLQTITVERDGQRMYLTHNGTPMEMPAKFERMVRAALSKVSR